jgi:hypothetical protein
MITFRCHSEPYATCHSEGALRRCHSEPSEESHTAQGKLREESGDPSLSLRVTSGAAQGDKWSSSG